MSGTELVHKLVEDQRWSAIPVVIVSGRDACKVPNVVAHLHKPVPLAMLLDVIHRSLRRTLGLARPQKPVV